MNFFEVQKNLSKCCHDIHKINSFKTNHITIPTKNDQEYKKIIDFTLEY